MYIHSSEPSVSFIKAKRNEVTNWMASAPSAMEARVLVEMDARRYIAGNLRGWLTDRDGLGYEW